MRCSGAGVVQAPPDATAILPFCPRKKVLAGNVADVVLMPTTAAVSDTEFTEKYTFPLTSQSPAVNAAEVQLKAAPLVMLVTVAFAWMYSPTPPAFTLLFVVVPTMPAVCDGVMAPVALIAATATVPVNVGDALNTASPVPVSSDRTPANCAEVVAANCDRLPLVSANVVPHDSPVPLVYFRALLAVLQLGSAAAVGAAEAAVVLAMTVFAAIGPSAVAVTAPQAGAVLGPVDTIACPAVEPAGLSSCTGESVAAVEASAAMARDMPRKIRFMLGSQKRLKLELLAMPVVALYL